MDFWISVWISADGVRDFFRDGPLAVPNRNQPETSLIPGAWIPYDSTAVNKVTKKLPLIPCS